MKILGIETSCDETASAVVEDGKIIISNVVASSSQMHRKYGGIVPEVAARKQLESMIPILSEALKDIKPSNIDAIAVTVGPGLIGSLLVGVEAAKTLAFAWEKPLIPVNHVLAHIYANFISNENERENSPLAQSRDNIEKSLIAFPAISLVVSGGHTELYLMENVKSLKWLGGTLDDAAGEAFDKTARLLGFENRGGLAIEEAASQYQMINATLQIKLPRPMMHDGSLNFSFSGLKTAVMREWKKANDQYPKAKIEQITNMFAYEIQEAITDVLVAKTIKAAQLHQAKSILLSGGVAANKRLREKFEVQSSKFKIVAPPPALCTDNAAAIAAYAFFRVEKTDWKNIHAEPNLSVEINS